MPRPLSAFFRLALPAAVFLAVAGCAEEAEIVEHAAAPVTAVEVLEVASTGGGGEIRASGLVSYKRETELSFGAPGEIESLSADVGDRVASGQVLASLRKTTSGADAAETALARQTAQQNFERISRLFEAGAASQSELDNARLALERSRERVAIVAPASGVILRRNAEPGQMVNAGQPVLSLAETRYGLVVNASMTASEVAAIKTGMDATINIRGREPLAGRVARIAEKGTQSGVFTVEVQVAAPEGLRSGEVAEVVVAGSDATASAAEYVVPAISLIDARADQGVVFVVGEDGRAKRRGVETGGVSDRGVTILKGLEQGDRVVTRGASMVRDGDLVSVSAQ